MRKKRLLGFALIFLLFVSLSGIAVGEAELIWSGKGPPRERYFPFDNEITQLEFVEISNDKIAIMGRRESVEISFYSLNPAGKEVPSKSDLSEVGSGASLSTEHALLGRRGHKWGYRFKLPNQDFKAATLIESTAEIGIINAEKGIIETGFTVISFEDVLEYGFAVETTQVDVTTAIISITKNYLVERIKPNDWIYIDPTAVVSTESADDSEYPVIAVDDLNIYVAWMDYNSGPLFGQGIFFKTKSKKGTWGPNTELVSTETNDWSGYPTIAIDDTNIYLAWADYTNYGGSGGDDIDIFFKTKSKTGAWTDAITQVVSTETTGVANEPTIAVDDSNIYIAWYDDTNYGGSGTDRDIFFKTKTKTGGLASNDINWASPTEVVSTESTSSSSYYPRLAIDDTNIYIVWEDVLGPPYNRRIFFKTKSKTGAWADANPQLVTTESEDNTYYPTIAIDDSNIYVAWEERTEFGGSGGDYDIFFKTKSKTGAWTDANTQLVSTESTGDYATNASIVVNDFNIYIAWEDISDFGGSGTDADIFFKRRPKTGNWSDANTEVITIDTALSEWPATAIDDSNVYIVWFGYIDLNYGTDYDILFSSLKISNCGDGIRNGNEVGVDCGGDCPACGACIPVIKNGSTDNKIDVVFIGSGFNDLNKFAEVVDDAIDYRGLNYGLMSVEPFKSRKTAFNFWRIDTTQTFSGGWYLGDDGNWHHNARYEYEAKDMFDENCSFGDELILLLIEPRIHSHANKVWFTDDGAHEAFVTIGEEYLNDANWPLDVRSLATRQIENFGNSKTDVIRTVVHEFGHSFGGLEDEYKTWMIINHDSGTIPNCDDNLDGLACDKWSDITDSCLGPPFDFCHYDDWFKAYKNTIMKDQFDLNVDFFPINERELEKDINETVVDDDANTSASDIFHYDLTLTFKDGNISVKEISLGGGNSPNRGSQPVTGYKIEIKDLNSNSLYDFNFSFPTLAVYSVSTDWFDENGDQVVIPDEPVQETRSDFNYTVIVPFFKDGGTLELYDTNSKFVLEEDISDLKPLKYTLGYGGNKIYGADYNITYSLVSQPVNILKSQDINILFGIHYYLGD